MTSRRRFLRGALYGAGGVALGLPYLESLRGVARAQGAAAPQRLVVIMSSQGMLQDAWIPGGTGGLSMPDVLAPLNRHRNDVSIVSGLDNAVRWQVDPVGGGGHNPAARTLFSAWPYAEVMNADGTVPSQGELIARGFSGRDVVGAPWGPSIDQVVAARIAATNPLPSLHLRIGGPDTGENELFFAGREGSVSAVGGEHRPARVYSQLTGMIPDDPGSTPPPTPEVPDLATRLRNRRAAVLGAVAGQYSRLQGRVSRDDRARLEAHAAFVEDLERRSRVSGGMTGGGGPPSSSCSAHEQSFPGGYAPGSSDWDQVTAPAQMDNAALALSCDLARVVTVQFTDYHGPTFPYLGASIPGGWANWHEMVHGDAASDRAVRAEVYRFYAEQVAYLLDRLASIDEGGSRLLDNTLVLWMSEFGDAAAHWTGNMPVVMAGGVGLRTGQHMRFTGRTTNDLFSAVLGMFGFEDTRFGLQRGGDGSNLNRGPLDIA